MEEAQKQETKIKKIKDEYEKLKVDTRMLRDQEQSLHRALEPKVCFVLFIYGMLRGSGIELGRWNQNLVFHFVLSSCL